MRLLLLSLMALALGVGAAIVVAGCGDDSKLIPARDAKALDRYADRVGSAANDQDCQIAEELVVAARDRVTSLPQEVDPALKANLEQGFANLGVQAAKECQGTTATTDTTTTDTTATTDTVPTTATTQTTTTQTTTTQTTTTQTTTTDTTTTDQPPQDGGGGTPAP